MTGPALALFLAAANPSDPIAPALDGKVQCFAPDVARKSCGSIGYFAKDADGHIANRTLTRVSNSPLIVVDNTGPVTIKGGAVCAPFTPDDIDTAKFTVDGKPAGDQESASIRKELHRTMARFLNHELCTSYAPDGDGFVAHVSVDGKRSPDLDQKMIWAPEKDGYRVAP